jgi:hypothetical protein
MFTIFAARKVRRPCRTVRPRVLAKCCSSVVVGIVSFVNRSKEVIEDEICHLSAQGLTGGQVRAEMHSGKIFDSTLPLDQRRTSS